MVDNITLGADPELFLARKGKVISAEGLIGGTKEKPRAISKHGHFVQEDNIMVEFNIPASETLKEFTDNINYIKDYLDSFAKLTKCETLIQSSAYVDEKYLTTLKSKEFGCEGDFDVYLKRKNERPCSNTTLRTCGGHIHVGYSSPSRVISEQIVKAMDIYLGLESLVLDGDSTRRSMYGRAGCFRAKPYGVEYRTLSNFWIKNDSYISWAYNATFDAIKLVNSGKMSELEEYFPYVRDAINTNSIDLAEEVRSNIDKKLKSIKIK